MQRICHASYLRDYSSSASSTSYLSPSKMEQYHYNHLNRSFYDAIAQSKRYTMEELAEYLNIDLDHTHGNTSTKIIKQIIRQNSVQVPTPFKVWQPNNQSLNEIYRDMPSVSGVSPAMIPDVIVSKRQNTDNILLFCEEDSSQGLNMEASMHKACYYAKYLARFFAIRNWNYAGKCIVFPSAHLNATSRNSCVVVVSCKWSYAEFRFEFDAETLELNNRFSERIMQLITDNFQLPSQGHNDLSHYLYKLKLDDVNNAALFVERYNCIFQYRSGNSIVLKVRKIQSDEENVLKFVDKATWCTLEDIKTLSHGCSYLLHFTEKIHNFEMQRVLTFPACLQPLDETCAKECLSDFVTQLHTALESVHAFGIEHCDVRLDNICFRSDLSVVLIDLDYACDRNMRTWESKFCKFMNQSCMYRNFNVESLDFVQLGYLILWVSHFRHVDDSGFLFMGNDQYHKMNLCCTNNETEFVQNLIREGK